MTMTNEKPEIIDNTNDISMPFTRNIYSYGADMPVDGLVQRLKKEDIIIPDFQREFVWNIKQASRFIESLLLELPIPDVFFSVEENTGKYLVIDGQQRLRSIQDFCSGKFKNEKIFALKGVGKEFENITYDTLETKQRRDFDNYLIHITIVKKVPLSSENSKTTESNEYKIGDSIYSIFERLNTGGTLLSPQEIRNSIYHGKFNNLLKELSADKIWSDFDISNKYRLKDQELILRFFALLYCEKYTNPLKTFLSNFMDENKNLDKLDAEDLKNTFKNNIEIIFEIIGKDAFRTTGRPNAAVYDAVMVALAKRQKKGDIKDKENFKKQYDALLTNKEFLELCESGTAAPNNVEKRMKLANEKFEGVK